MLDTFRKLTITLATTLVAGLIFVNIYTSMIDAVSWGSSFPASIQTAREYFKTVNPGNFFRIFSPINQILAGIGLIICWKADKKIRLYCGIALLFAVALDVFTFGYFYPRNEILFASSIESNLDAIKIAWAQWSRMNWVRTGLGVINLIFDFAALSLLCRNYK